MNPFWGIIGRVGITHFTAISWPGAMLWLVGRPLALGWGRRRMESFQG
jgi:hypothetical protein